MVSIEFQIEGEKQVSRRLGILANGIKNFREPLQTIGGELLQTFEANFASRGALFGGWAARKKEQPWPLLERTGTMRRNFKSRVSSDSVYLYNPTPYFKYHQSNQARSRLPRRIMMLIDRQRKDFIVKAFQSYIVRLMRGGNA